MDGWRERVRGEYRFSSLVKLKKKGKFCFVFYIPEKDFFFIYDVIVKQNIYKRPANHYCGRYRDREREVKATRVGSDRPGPRWILVGRVGVCTAV